MFDFSCIIQCLNKAVFLFLAALFVSSASLGEPSRYVWVDHQLDAAPQGREQVLNLELVDADGETVARSSDCRMLRQTSDVRVCGRIPHRKAGNFALRLTWGNEPGTQYVTTLDRNLAIAPRAFDVVIVLDGSQSMHKNDPDELRVSAARRFWQLSRKSRRISTIAFVVFRDGAEVLLRPTPPSEIDDIEPILDQLEADGATDYDAAFRVTDKLLSELPGISGRTVIFLSDGEPWWEYRESHGLLVARGCPVCTIGLSEEADRVLLEKIAEDTGGQYFDAPAPEQLRGIFTQIFRIIESQRRVFKRVVPAGPDNELRLVRDDALYNPFLTLVPLSGKQSVFLDGVCLRVPGDSDLSIHALAGETPGADILKVQGDGRLLCELTADTDLALNTVPLNPAGPAGLPLVFGFYLQGDEHTADVRADCFVTDPGGEKSKIRTIRNSFGLWSARYDRTRSPGRYRAVIEVRGRSPGGEDFYRQTPIVFDRTGQEGPHVSGRSPFAQFSAPESDGVSGSSLRVAPRDIPEEMTGRLSTTLTTSREVIEFDRLFPGVRGEAQVEVLVHTADGKRITCAVRDVNSGSTDLTLEGSVPAGRPGILTVIAEPSTSSAGESFTATLAVSVGSREWTIPVRGNISCPEIRASPVFLVESRYRMDGSDRVEVGSGSVEVNVVPTGICDVAVSSESGDLTISPVDCQVGQEPVLIDLILKLPPPSRRTSWSGSVQISGPGLKTVNLPVQLQYGHLPAELPAQPTIETPSAGLPFSLPAVLLLLLLLLCLLVLLCRKLRGSQRALFIFASAAIHAIILLIALPESKLREFAESTVTSIGLAGGTPIVAERIPAETDTEHASSGVPARQQRTKSKAIPQPAQIERSEDLDPRDREEIEARPEPSVPSGKLERQPMVIDQVMPEPVDLPKAGTRMLPLKEAQSQAGNARKASTVNSAAETAQGSALSVDSIREELLPEESPEHRVPRPVERENVAPRELAGKTVEPAARRKSASIVSSSEPLGREQRTNRVLAVNVAKLSLAGDSLPLSEHHTATPVSFPKSVTAERPPELPDSPDAVQLREIEGQEKDFQAKRSVGRPAKSERGKPGRGRQSMRKSVHFDSADAPGAEPAGIVLAHAARVSPAAGVTPGKIRAPEQIKRPDAGSTTETMYDGPRLAPGKKNVESAKSERGKPGRGRQSMRKSIHFDSADAPGAKPAGIVLAHAARVSPAAGLTPGRIRAPEQIERPDAGSTTETVYDGPRLAPGKKNVESGKSERGKPGRGRQSMRKSVHFDSADAPGAKPAGIVLAHAARVSPAAGLTPGRIRAPEQIEKPDAGNTTEIVYDGPRLPRGEAREPSGGASSAQPRGTTEEILRSSFSTFADSGGGREVAAEADYSPVLPDRFLRTSNLPGDSLERGTARTNFVDISSSPELLQPARTVPAGERTQGVESAGSPGEAITPVPSVPASAAATAEDRERGRVLEVRPTPALQTGSTDDRRARPVIAPGRNHGSDRGSRWQNVFPNLRHSGDWDCDRTAMMNLAHQFERRTGSVLPFDSRNIELDDSGLHEAPFLFMSGHRDFRFSDSEAEHLRNYLRRGGYLWVNDSTDVGNQVFDRAVHREIARILPGVSVREIPLTHDIFRGPYDLTEGYKGYPVPPGDKYREDRLQGMWSKGKLRVIYTRNDYGDGLEIDLKTAPLMDSLTDLSPEEMQEASVRMGTNIAMYFINDGQTGRLRFENAPRDTSLPRTVSLRKKWDRVRHESLDLFSSIGSWQAVDSSQGNYCLEGTLKKVPGQKDSMTVEFDLPSGRSFKSWWMKAEATAAWPERELKSDNVIIMDVASRMPGGARVALAFTGSAGYVETEPIFVRPGINRNVAFDLSRKTFKTQESNWECSGAWPPEMKVNKIHILTYPQSGDGRMEYSNLRLAKN